MAPLVHNEAANCKENAGKCQSTGKLKAASHSHPRLTAFQQARALYTEMCWHLTFHFLSLCKAGLISFLRELFSRYCFML